MGKGPVWKTAGRPLPAWGGMVAMSRWEGVAQTCRCGRERGSAGKAEVFRG